MGMWLGAFVGSMDPYQRAPRSPRGKKPMPTPLDGSNPQLNDEGAKSPTSDQVCVLMYRLHS